MCSWAFHSIPATRGQKIEAAGVFGVDVPISYMIHQIENA